MKLFSLALLLGLLLAGPRPAPAQTDAQHQAVVAMYPVMLQAVQDRQLTKARDICQQVIQYEPRSPIHRYNLACIESLAGAPDAAFAALNQALTLGYADASSLRTDADLAAVRRDPRFAAVLQGAARNASTAAPAATIKPVGARPATSARPATTTRPAAATRPAVVAPARPAARVAVAQPVAGKMAGNRPVGLFFMTRYWMATRSLEKSAYYFTADGRVYVDPTGFSAAELARQHGSRGTFQVSGNTLTVKWSDGQKSSNTLEDVHAASFSWDTGMFLGVHPFSSAQQLLGTFEGGNSVSTSAGSIATSGTYTFRRDGTYSRGGVASASSVSDGSVVNTGAQGQTVGRWQLNGFILTLTDNQGRTLSGASFPFNINGTAARPDRMYFAGTLYKRQ